MELLITLSLIVLLFVVLGSGLWIGLSLLGVAVFAMEMFTQRPVGDSMLLEDGLLQNFHLKPGRTAFQLNNRQDTLNNFFQHEMFYQFQHKRIVIVDRPVTIEPLRQKIDIDLVIISKDPKLYISQLTAVFNCKQFVFDASNPLWKIEKWQKECETLNLSGHSIPGQGAFIYDIGM